MAPEEIEGREFFVGLRGYDKDEVHQFLAEVAREQRSLLDQLAAATTAHDGAAVTPTASTRDDFEDLGASVAAILRTAKESAASMSLEAEGEAATMREEAERYAEERRRAADEYATARRDEADAFHTVAARAAQEAQAEADRRMAEAEERIRAMEVESHQRARQAAEAVVADAGSRLSDVSRRAEAMRAQLKEANDEIQLALLALGDPVEDHDGAVRVAAGFGDASQNGNSHH